MIKTYGGRKLGARPAHRKMMLRNLAVQMVHYERLTTTQARAKELKVYFDRSVSALQKINNPLIKRRKVEALLAPNGYQANKKLLDTLLPRFGARRGGFIRVVLLPPRSCDQARLARVELTS